jgi:hypothetical protein
MLGELTVISLTILMLMAGTITPILRANFPTASAFPITLSPFANSLTPSETRSTTTTTTTNAATPLINTNLVITEITGVSDCNGNSINFNDTTQSNCVEFSFRVMPSVNVTFPVTFDCSIDDSRFNPCTSGIQYDNLFTGKHTFVVRATDAHGNQDQVISLQRNQWIWFVGINPFTTENNETGGLASTVSPLGLQQLNDKSLVHATQTNQEQLRLAQAAANAQTKVNALNPPFQRCGTGTTEALYFIEGNANINSILFQKPAEVGLILYVDLQQIPRDIENQIINTNNVYVKGQLVSNPYDLAHSRSVNFDIKRIYTSCETTPFKFGKQIINKGTGRSNQPFVAAANQAGINPPFQSCLVQGNTTAGRNPQTFFAQTSKGPVLPQTVNLTNGSTGTLTTIPSDYAKHLIVGKLRGSVSEGGSGNQFVTFVLHNVFLNAESSLNPKILEGNNNQIAADIVIDPGQPGKTEKADETVTEISTMCQDVPFVSEPRAIGNQEVTFIS